MAIVVSKIIGGLGNQMFQIAAGMAVAKRCSSPLLLDISALRKYRKHHGYLLPEVFKTSPELASKWKLIFLLKSDYRKVLYGPITGQVSLRQNTRNIVCYQLHQGYSQDFDKLSGPCYLSGYWQSEKFFVGIEDEIRNLFSFNEPADSVNAEILSKICSCNAVSLHVRRGDYVTEQDTNVFHGICSWDYYKAAIEYVEAKVPDAKFFGFSDDPEWLRNKAKGMHSLEVVDINHGPKSYLDMYLMTRCKHHIIANSSFSWWGAYLGLNEQKIVVAPSPWLRGDPEGIKDIYCNGWTVF